MDSPSLVSNDLLRVDGAAYTVESVKRTAYRFIDGVALELRIEGTDILCQFAFTPPVPTAAAAAFLIEFQKELLDQDLRHTIAIETESLRTTILGLAFDPAKL